MNLSFLLRTGHKDPWTNLKLKIHFERYGLMKCGRVEWELHNTACSHIMNKKVCFVDQHGFHEQG